MKALDPFCMPYHTLSEWCRAGAWPAASLKEKDNKEFGKTIVKEPVNSIHAISVLIFKLGDVNTYQGLKHYKYH